MTAIVSAAMHVALTARAHPLSSSAQDGEWVPDPDQQWCVLIADGDRGVHRQLNLMLSGFGHATRSVFDGVSVPAALADDRHDVLLLATALGNGPDGFSVCRRLRAGRDWTPIIMLGDLDEEADIVTGLEAGADDFMAKPPRLAELRARIKAILRRGRYRHHTAPLRLGHVVLDHAAHEVRRDSQPVDLTYTEYELLLILMSRPDRVLSRQQLLQAISGRTSFGDPRAVDVYIRHLRVKLEREPSCPTLIQTVRGVGYKATTSVHDRR
jgi:two-component system response regulator MtrA